ncbi:hypothetical protein ANTQUA_LOCUS5925 [Anthophora quadrimaculata]
MRLLQANLDHSRGAQDLFCQALREWGVALAVAAEPYSIPSHPLWFGDRGGSVAIVGSSAPGALPVALLERGQGYLAVEWGEFAVVGCYAPPSRNTADFGEYLGGVGRCIRRRAPRPVLVLGDFNAHAIAWASPRTDARGRVLLDWAAELELRLLNRGLVCYVRAADGFVHCGHHVGVVCGRAACDGVEGCGGDGDAERSSVSALRLLKHAAEKSTPHRPTWWHPAAAVGV